MQAVAYLRRLRLQNQSELFDCNHLEPVTFGLEACIDVSYR